MLSRLSEGDCRKESLLRAALFRFLKDKIATTGSLSGPGQENSRTRGIHRLIGVSVELGLASHHLLKTGRDLVALRVDGLHADIHVLGDLLSFETLCEVEFDEFTITLAQTT